MHRSPSRHIALVTALMLAATGAGCSGVDLTQAAFPEPSVTLTIGVGDTPGRYSYQVTEEFARRVSEGSQRSLVVEVENIDTKRPRWNQAFIAQLQKGQIDLLVVQSQAWDTIGVDTFQPLYVPFLITDEEHLDAVVTSDIADDMLAGLEGTGLTGLSVVPGGLRRLFSDTQAATRPSDVAGEGVRVAYSETIWSMLQAVGAHPDDPNGQDVDVAFRDGRVSLLDSTFPLSDGFLTSPKGAADLWLYPLAFTIAVGDEVLSGLSEDHRELLVTTARDVAHWSADTRPSEAAEAQALCERNPGAEVVLAGEDAIQEWRTATAGLAAELRADPVVDELAARIERVGAELDTRAEPVKTCSGSGGSEEPAAGPGPNVPEEFPEGTYRKGVTAESLITQGVNPSTAHQHEDVWTMTLHDGVFVDPGCPGSTYEITDDRVVVTLGPEGESCGTAAGQVLFSAGWQLEGSSLTLTDVRSGHGGDILIANLFGGEPWTKIG